MDQSTKYACVCCGELTMVDRPPGTFQICPVCGWEDDNVQFKHPDLAGGANELSLNQARERYYRGCTNEKDNNETNSCHDAVCDHDNDNDALDGQCCITK
ncbi:MAG: hypothetical protein II983_02720 [Firmicutes bacterium]|nr:hypothetical protein [Bacillota bacterium]